MAKQKLESEKSNIESLDQGGNVSIAETETHAETKAIVDGWWMVDARLAKAETEEEAKKLFLACFRFEPREIIPANGPAAKGESYLYRDSVGPMYGIPQN